MKSARCYNLVLVTIIKDQGYALTIDYIKKKQKELTLMSPHAARYHFIFIILNIVCLLGREGYSIRALEIARYRRRKKDECKGGEER